MPQFDLGTFLPQIFWLIICFTALYAFTIGYSVPRLKKIYDDRWQHTQGTRIEAVKIHRQAQDITQAYEADLENARQEAKQKINLRLQEISQKTTDERNEILAEIKKKFIKGELILSERKIHAMVESQPLAQTLATKIISKLMEGRVPSKSLKAMLAQTLREKTSP